MGVLWWLLRRWFQTAGEGVMDEGGFWFGWVFGSMTKGTRWWRWLSGGASYGGVWRVSRVVAVQGCDWV